MSKRIIFCSDGTWNDAATNTNVYKIFKAMNFTAEQCPYLRRRCRIGRKPRDSLSGRRLR